MAERNVSIANVVDHTEGPGRHVGIYVLASPLAYATAMAVLFTSMGIPYELTTTSCAPADAQANALARFEEAVASASERFRGGAQ